MTVAVENPVTSDVGDGATTSFPLGFTYGATSDVSVSVMVSGSSIAMAWAILGSNVVFDEAPPSGAAVVFSRGTPREQNEGFPAAGPFPSTSFEKQLDRLTRIEQEQDHAIADISSRALRVPPGETVPPLPSGSRRGSGVVGFDPTGMIPVIYSPGQFKGDPGGNVMAVGAAMAMANISIPAGADVVMTTGYTVKGDGGHAFYRRVTAQPVHPGCFQSLDGSWWEVLPDAGEINVAWFGADPTGATPSDAAFIGAHQMRAAYRSTWSYGDPLSNLSIRVPGGKILITNSESLCPSTYTTKTSGFVMRGDFYATTNIIFAPTGGSKIMFYNQAYLFSMVEDITFVGTGLDQIFYRADMSVNNQQGWRFNRCRWIGTWGKGFFLTGTNNNSEMYFNDCGGSGTMGQFLYTPPFANAAPSGSDQFLNYNFISCNMGFTGTVGGTAGSITASITSGVMTVTAVSGAVLAVGQTIASPAAIAGTFYNRINGETDRVVILNQLTGTAGGVGTYTVLNAVNDIASTTLVNLTNDVNCIVDMSSGGHVKFLFCDVSGWQSGAMYQLRGSTHSLGVCSFVERDGRYELKSSAAALLYMEWPQGAVLFSHVDMSSQANNYLNADGSIPTSIFIASQSTPGPQVQFKDGCQLIGGVNVLHGTNDFVVRRSIEFVKCDFMQHFDPYAAFTFPSSTNDYGAPDILLEGCRGKPLAPTSYAAWAANAAVAVGALVRSNNDNSVYICTTAGTTGAAAASITGAISGTALTVSATTGGAISVGQKIVGTTTSATSSGSITSGSNVMTSMVVSAGALVVGQFVGGTGIPAGTQIQSIGSGTVTLTQNATSTTTSTYSFYGAQPVLEDTIITAGSGTNWTVNRPQTVASQAMTLTGGPASASASIPDGSAVWAFYANGSRDYFNDGVVTSPAFAGITVRPATRVRVIEFGGQMPRVGDKPPEVIVAPNSLILAVRFFSPPNAVTSTNPADYLIETDEGTALLKVFAKSAKDGVAAAATSLNVGTGRTMAKRKVRLLAGGAGGGNVDQVNSLARCWMEVLE